MSPSIPIGQAAAASGISRKMIRYYEDIGVLPPAQRSAAGYRFYNSAAVAQLCFIKRARDMGFSLERIQQLMGFWHDDQRHSADVKALAQQYIAELDDNITRMQQMRDELHSWVASCHGDDRSECAIIEQLTPHVAPQPEAEPEPSKP